MRRALAGVLVLFTMLAGSAGEARADDLVSNINVFPNFHSDATSTFVDVSGRKAQGFTTGSNEAGYTLESVVAYIMVLPNFPAGNPGQPLLKIYSSTTAAADADKRPDMLLYMLASPATLSVEPTYGTYDLPHSIPSTRPMRPFMRTRTISSCSRTRAPSKVIITWTNSATMSCRLSSRQ